MYGALLARRLRELIQASFNPLTFGYVLWCKGKVMLET
jgi:hypothetical protein